MEENSSNLSKAFEKNLNAHGYGFQYSVLKYIESLNAKHQCAWDFEVTEFPVAVQGAGTRIDFILKRRAELHGSSQNRPFFMLAECKRVNAALSNWCFAESPYVKAEYSTNNVILERLHFASVPYASAYKWRSGGAKSYEIGLEVKSGEKGDAFGGGRSAIEDAATQICRGMNGMAQFCRQNLYMFGNSKTIDFLPVVLTTANLWVSDVELSESDLVTGKIDLERNPVKPCSWLLYQYHMSPGLKHGWETNPNNDGKTLGRAMEDEYIRTIPIVNPSGLLDFLNWSATIEVDWPGI